MINLARGSVILLMAVSFGVLFFFNYQAETALAIAIDSQTTLQQDRQEKQEKPVNQTVNKEEINVNIENSDDDEDSEKSSASAYRATAYCLQGRTASGSGVRRGIVAADPRVLPLGTRISVDAGSYSGTYVVADTGGAVKGRKLDIWVPSCAEAKRFGSKRISVSLVGRKKRKK